MEYRSAITLKPFDTITIPGVGTKVIGAIHQIRDNRYQIRLDEKFVESVSVDIDIDNWEQRPPERHDGAWAPDGQGLTTSPDLDAGMSMPSRSPFTLQTAEQMHSVMGTDPRLPVIEEGKTIRVVPGTDNETPADSPHL